MGVKLNLSISGKNNGRGFLRTKNRAGCMDLKEGATVALEKILTMFFIVVFSISLCWGSGFLNGKD